MGRPCLEMTEVTKNHYFLATVILHELIWFKSNKFDLLDLKKGDFISNRAKKKIMVPEQILEKIYVGGKCITRTKTAN